MDRKNLALWMIGSVLCLLAFDPPAFADEIEGKYFYGNWELRDPRVKKAITAIEIDKDDSSKKGGPCKPGVWGRDFGGPNGLGANTWRIKGNELQFIYVMPGRAREDSMLTGTVKPINDNEFEFTVTGGHYGTGKNKGLVFRMKKP